VRTNDGQPFCHTPRLRKARESIKKEVRLLRRLCGFTGTNALIRMRGVSTPISHRRRLCRARQAGAESQDCMRAYWQISCNERSDRRRRTASMRCVGVRTTIPAAYVTTDPHVSAPIQLLSK